MAPSEDLHRRVLAEKLLLLRDRFAQQAVRTRNTGKSNRAERISEMDLFEGAGSVVIASFRRGFLNIPGLGELVEWLDDESKPHPSGSPPNYLRCKENLFCDLTGRCDVIVENATDRVIKAGELLHVGQAVRVVGFRLRGLLRQQYPGFYPNTPPRTPSANPTPEEREVFAREDHAAGLEQCADSCRLLSTLIKCGVSAPEAQPPIKLSKDELKVLSYIGASDHRLTLTDLEDCFSRKTVTKIARKLMDLGLAIRP